jgi:hypothetical protein
LVQRFRDFHHRDKYRNIDDSEDIGIIQRGEGSSITLVESVRYLGFFWNLLLVKQGPVQDHVGTGRILDPDWVDLDIVNQWKRQCLSSHGTKCENPVKIWPTSPAWLIDIENKCVVPGQGRAPFVALSYRWGEASGFRVHGDTMAKLQKPDVLDSPEFSAHLPPIIRHAMYLTSVIGERYLWADALCIDHGDNAATVSQLNLMGAIYASAIVTIIAADGDSQDGLLGLRDVSAPRKLEQQVIPFGEEKIIVRNTDEFSMIDGTPYYDRGWTYQEYMMSTKRILFNQKELHWECQCSVWHEEMTLGTELDQYIDLRLGVILTGFPDWSSLGHIITKYNERELRYDEDALPGISGLLSVASRSFTGGFLYGLPEMLFDRALGWEPMWGPMNINLRRRTPSDRPTDSRLSPSGLPSWSWIGWQGLVYTGYGEAARINLRLDYIEETIPITIWYTSSSPSGSPLRRIRSTWFENRNGVKDFTKPLPVGWTSHKVPQDELTEYGPRLYPDGCSDYVFKHRNMPDEDCDSWYYPFPVTDIQETTLPFTPEQTLYIFCKTRKARLWAYQPGGSNVLQLRNEMGGSIGVLKLHNEEQQELFPKAVADNAPGRPVELVAIYQSRIYWKTWDEKQTRHIYPQEVFERYKVLWVEWKEGVAYRLASGYVEKADWEGLDLEEVSLILG